jgi:RNA recognition motif-containing protein
MGFVKLFVGNIPYECSQEEINANLSSINGFIKIDIIYTEDNITKGYGFITINNLYNAQELKQRSDIIFKGRILRFIDYQNDKSLHSNNYIYISNIPANKNRDWLREQFNNYMPIGLHFIIMNHNTGEYTSNGIVEILNNKHYNELINKKSINKESILYIQKYIHNR